MNERNRQVKDYICNHFCDDLPPMSQALLRSQEAGLKEIQVSEPVGKLLYLLAKLVKPKKILEIGTLGGYSALWLSKALEEGGQLITIECDPKHAKIAHKNIFLAGKQDQITIRQGFAAEVLQEMIESREGPFDLIFLDADKVGYPAYLEPCLKLARSGTLLLCDNLIPKRGVIGQPDPRDTEAVTIYTFNQLIANHPQLESIPLTTVSADNGRLDALGLCLVK